MSIIDAEFQCDRHKLTYFFEAAKRVDFRDLVSELFSMYKTRIWMAQVDPTSTVLYPDLEHPPEHVVENSDEEGNWLAAAVGLLPSQSERMSILQEYMVESNEDAHTLPLPNTSFQDWSASLRSSAESQSQEGGMGYGSGNMYSGNMVASPQPHWV